MGSASSSSLMYASYFFGVTHRLHTCRSQRESGTSERRSTNNRTRWTRLLVQQFQFPFRAIPPWLVRSCWVPIAQTTRNFRSTSQDIKHPITLESIRRFSSFPADSNQLWTKFLQLFVPKIDQYSVRIRQWINPKIYSHTEIHNFSAIFRHKQQFDPVKLISANNLNAQCERDEMIANGKLISTSIRF